MTRWLPSKTWKQAKPRLPKSVVIAKAKKKTIRVAKGPRLK